MRHRARSLNILALAPVAAIVAGVLGPMPHAVAAASKSPVPIVVAVDPAHGGRPSAAHPKMPFDRGAIGTNGLLEKNVDLDVSRRLAALLRDDLVAVVMTRSTDIYVSDAARLKASTRYHAALVVSIRAGSSANPAADGSLVLYPTTASDALAQTVSDALAAQIAADGVPDGGIASGDSAWARSRAPTVAVEMGCLTNRNDAELMATASFRQDVAIGVRDGIEAYMPAIIARRDAIRAWRSSHPGDLGAGSLEPASAALPGTTGFQFGAVIAWLAGISAVGLVLLFRDAVARALVVFGALIVRLLGAVMWLRRALVRRRRRRLRTRASTRSDDTPPRRSGSEAGSVYDDIPL